MALPSLVESMPDLVTLEFGGLTWSGLSDRQRF